MAKTAALYDEPMEEGPAECEQCNHLFPVDALCVCPECEMYLCDDCYEDHNCIK